MESELVFVLMVRICLCLGRSSRCASASESGQTVSVDLATAVKPQKRDAGLDCRILEWGDASSELAS